MPDFTFEIAAGCRDGAIVCGIDEAGRGPLAGPVVAAAAILPTAGLPSGLAEAVDDSKRLSAEQRERLFPEIVARARLGIGVAEVAEIDAINILRASLLAMVRAVAGLGVVPHLALVDGREAPALTCAVRTVIGGDGTCLSIAAASIVAKVTRDRLMTGLARDNPGFGWERNAGYATVEHRAALLRLGPTPHHRRSFATVAACFGEDGLPRAPNGLSGLDLRERPAAANGD